MTGTNIHIAASFLKSGNVVAIPTETVYGLAANAYDPDAVLRIFEIKQRPRFNPLIVHLSSINQLGRVAEKTDPVLLQLAYHFWPGPLTILVKKSALIADLVTAGSEFVAVRVPNHPLTLKLLSLIDFPLAAPSANEFGKISPTTAKHVEESLGNKINYILDGGSSVVGIESTIIKMDAGKIVILRPGGINAEQISEITGYVPQLAEASNQAEAPGMLKSHYAPTIPLYLGKIDELISVHAGKKIGILAFTEQRQDASIIFQKILSPSGDLHEAAKNLFSYLHQLEQSGAELIISELLPETGIGIAVNDRLRRASA